MPDRDFYQLVLDSIEDYAVFTTDKTGAVNSWNSGASNLLGFTEEDIIGQNARIFFTEEDQETGEDKKELEKALKYGRAIDDRYHVRKDKTSFFASGKLFPMYDANGKHIGFTKVMRNIEAKKVAEQQQHDAQVYAESIINSAREPILVLNEDLTINTANQSFYKLFNLKPNLPSAPIYDVAKGFFNIPQLTELLERVKTADENIRDYEVVHKWPKLGVKFFLINARRLLHSTTRSQMILFSIQDITQQRTLEQQKDDFISIASHEIRTPVTVIKAYAQMLHKRSSLVRDDMIANSAMKINEKAEKLMSLVSYLLDASQLDSGQMIIKKEYFNISDLIKESVDELTLINSHEFVIKGKVTDPVFADRFRISQVLNNLLNNAIKYSPTQSTVTLQVAKRKNYVVVSVQDSGSGIPKEEQTNIFKRFWRASSAQKHNIGGIGLGLHISSEIISKHRGKIWLKSESNKGSAFYFSIPIENIEESDFNNSY